MTQQQLTGAGADFGERTPAATVVVADEQLAAELRRTAETPVIAVADYLQAIGEFTQHHVASIIGRLDPMAGAIEPTVRALRQVSPDGRLLLVIDPAQEPDAMRAVRLGFDDYLVRPINPADLLAELKRGNGRKAAPPPAIALQQPAIDQIEPVSSIDNQSDQTAIVDEVLVADGELVEQMVRQRSAVPDVALQLIMQRLGGAAVELNTDADNSQTCVPVRFESQSFGYLCSAVAAEKDLIVQAEWLARWLTLERHVAHLADLALRDDLTGLWNRRYFDRVLNSILQRARAERFRVTLMVYDIDDFKTFNDTFGHQAGDQILCETARLMKSVTRRHDVVARIGGDEFAVIFWDAEAPRRQRSEHPHSVRRAAERFQQAVWTAGFPKLAEQAPGTLTISGGLASYPWDGQTPEQLKAVADQMLLESKRQGKNVLTFGPGAIRACEIDEKIDQSPDSDDQENHK